MSFLDRIEIVLRDAGEPLHYEEITRRLISTGAWSTTGKTPEQTVNARINEDRKHNPSSRFQRTEKGIFALRSSSPVAAPVQRPLLPPKVRPRRGKRPVSFLDAAERVLERFGGKQPMHYREITRKALEIGLLTTEGKTPEATLYAQIITDVERREKRGERSRFVRHGKGIVGLTRWNVQGLTFQIERSNDAVREQLHERIRKMAPADFENLIGALLTKLGFEEVVVTARSGDGGIDVRGTMVTADVVRTRMAVQVKRWKSNVLAPVVQQVRGSLGAHEQGLIITTSRFSSGACEEAQRSNATPVALMNGEQLVKLLVEHEVGVRRKTQFLLEINDEEA